MRISLTLFTLLFFSIANAAAFDYRVEQITDELRVPWSVAFLPSGDLLVTEQAGKLKRIHQGKISEVSGVPEVYFKRQGGLLDVLVDRDFADNGRIFLTYSHGNSTANATRLVSAKLDGNALVDLKVLFTARPDKRGELHYGSRLVQLADGSLLMTIGEGSRYRDQAQQLDSHLGKIIRLNPDGSVPENNPFNDGDENTLAEIWSFGHRNPQAIVLTDQGDVYAHEHGPQGGDEINHIQASKNYGWPVLTKGREYSGAVISTLDSAPGMEPPLVNWTPSIAPGGMAFYAGSQFPELQGDLLVASLKQGTIRRIDLEAGNVLSDTQIFPKVSGRMRDIRSGPDGAIYVLVASRGELLKITADSQ